MSLQHAVGDVPANSPALTVNLALSTRAPWRPLSLALRGYLVGSRDKDATAPPPRGESQDGPPLTQMAEAPVTTRLGLRYHW